MNITVIGSRAVFDEALESARQVGKGGAVKGLAAPLAGALGGRLEEAWNEVERALRQGFQFGKEKAQAALDAAVTKVEELLVDAGKQARDVHELLLQRLHEFAQTYTQGALARVPTAVEVGGQAYTLTTVQCTQKLIVTGSIKANLTEVFSLASNGGQPSTSRT